MKRRRYDILFGSLIPILFLVWFFGQRFKTLPDWARDVYPFVFWPLLGIVVLFLIIFLVERKTRQ
jgi:fructose-specific phosphotransferase system IIC component